MSCGIHHIDSLRLSQAQSCGEQFLLRQKEARRKAYTDAIPKLKASHCPQGKEVWKKKQTDYSAGEYLMRQI
ncbi:hypothetical protein Tco_0443375 [Tanacetum coccineum]